MKKYIDIDFPTLGTKRCYFTMSTLIELEIFTGQTLEDILLGFDKQKSVLEQIKVLSDLVYCGCKVSDERERKTIEYSIHDIRDGFYECIEVDEEFTNTIFNRFIATFPKFKESNKKKVSSKQ